MPRGDGKKSGEPRQQRENTGVAQYIPAPLERRQAAFDAQKSTQGEKRPGSQRKGRAN